MIMKGKMKFCILAVFVLTVAAMWFGTKEAGAFTIAEDGKYALVLNLKGSDKEVANIDGQSGKVIKFNVDEGETVLNVSELTNGVVAYNEIRKFSGWAKSSATVDTIEELSIDDFNSAGSLGGVEYTNGCSLYALFLGDEIEQQEEYRVLLNGNGGEITGSALPGQTKILLTYKEDELKSLDVSKYAAEREGCTFCGWGCNGEILTSALDKSYFKSGDSLVIYALYKKTTFEGTSYVLNLDANGGMIEDEFVKKYDYLGADDMVMPVFHYIPQRSGYRFKGWNSKKDSYLAVKGGSPLTSHAHMDAGSFIYEREGIRWGIDLGMQNYLSLESRGVNLWDQFQEGQRWEVFRLGNMAHNTLTINNKRHLVNSYAPISRIYKSEDMKGAEVDLISVFADDMEKVVRIIYLNEEDDLIVKDELVTGEKEALVTWIMVTPAEAKIIGKNQIELAKDGHRMLLTVAAPDDVEMKLWSNEPLHAFDEPNPGSMRVGFETHLLANRKNLLKVTLNLIR